ncbi:NTP transferase domain-containing protein [Aggregatibacter actinomycetemcomitans]|uniref:NTP transferase domain-containing protein n=1 Tax=Aggregatibacter actinomycetemcomitans TaxID=714 RepID=UPI00197C5FBC|nr:NTP transferase domain-containing protein [Aggregatibacter actinomycetemcomitans]MBN6081957.1 NTP transferase domain-containing protein [Aggregatibacter actinomycetemcomitans]
MHKRSKKVNAIILAAGLGSRFKELTKNNHKALFKINETPNIEKTIQYLQEIGIDEIHIVTGHQANLFSYLSNKYNCDLIHNIYYKKYNSIYSFYLAIEHFNNTFVIDADVVLLDNPFCHLKNSTYYTILRDKSLNKEWIPLLDSNNKFIKTITISDLRLPSLLGISYWNEKDCNIIKNNMNSYLNDEVLQDKKLYWDNIPLELINEGKIKVETNLLPRNKAGEIDDISDYEKITEMVKR